MTQSWEGASCIVEQEGTQPWQLKKWDVCLGAFGNIAFAIAHLYSTLLKEDDYASGHPACFFGCCIVFLPRHVVGGTINPLK